MRRLENSDAKSRSNMKVVAKRS